MYITDYIAEIFTLCSIIFAALCNRSNIRYPFYISIVVAILLDVMVHYHNYNSFSIINIYKYVIFLSYLVLAYYHRGFSLYKNALFGLSIIGMSLAMSLGNLFSIFLGIELSSLPLYLAVYERQSPTTPKYIMLGMVSTAIEVFGIALIYLTTKTMDCFDINTEMYLHPSNLQNIGVHILLIAFFIKLAFIPFHNWLLEIMSLKKYEESLSFIIVVSKLATLVILIRLIIMTFNAIDLRFCITIFSSISVLFASLCAVRTHNIKRLFSYISIEHAAFVVCGLENISEVSMKGMMLFIFSEILAFIGLFAVLKCIKHNTTHEISNIGELRGLGDTSPELAISLSCLFISLTGIPPLVGFWGKYYILISLADIKNYTLVVVCLISIIISGIYTINIIKNMWLPSNISFKFDKRIWIVHVLAISSIVLPLLNEKISLLIGNL